MNLIAAKPAALKDTKPYQYAIRFVFGGLCTVLAGVIAKKWGPGVGGLFLAFPAIFPAGACLVEGHQKQEKRRIGCDGTRRGRVAASVDAQGAVLGSFGLAAFAVVCWKGLDAGHNPICVITAAVCVWAIVSFFLWLVRKSRRFRRRRMRIVGSPFTKAT